MRTLLVLNALVWGACGIPTHLPPPPPAGLTPPKSGLRALRIEVRDFFVGNEWRIFVRYGPRTRIYRIVDGLSDATWRLAYALEDLGLNVESERLDRPADLRLSVAVFDPYSKEGDSGYWSQVQVTVSDSAGNKLVDRTFERAISKVGLFEKGRRTIFDARPNWMQLSSVVLPDVVDALETAERKLGSGDGAVRRVTP